MINLRDQILKSQIAYYNGLIAKHQQNVEISVSYTHLTLPTKVRV